MAVLIEHVVAAIKALQFLAAEGVLWRPLAAQGSVQTQHPIRTAANHREVVGDLQNRQPLLEP